MQLLCLSTPSSPLLQSATDASSVAALWPTCSILLCFTLTLRSPSGGWGRHPEQKVQTFILTSAWAKYALLWPTGVIRPPGKHQLDVQGGQCTEHINVPLQNWEQTCVILLPHAVRSLCAWTAGLYTSKSPMNISVGICCRSLTVSGYDPPARLLPHTHSCRDACAGAQRRVPVPARSQGWAHFWSQHSVFLADLRRW